MIESVARPNCIKFNNVIYSKILISGSLDKWIRRLAGSKVQEAKFFFAS